MDLTAYLAQLTTDLAAARQDYGSLTADQRLALACRAEVARFWQSLRTLQTADAGQYMTDLLASPEYQWLASLPQQGG